jgi:hypothetical protein
VVQNELRPTPKALPARPNKKALPVAAVPELLAWLEPQVPRASPRLERQLQAAPLPAALQLSPRESKALPEASSVSPPGPPRPVSPPQEAQRDEPEPPLPSFALSLSAHLPAGKCATNRSSF